MEQTRYWMWTRNKLVAERVPSAAHVNQEYSWEEQAFAEDSAGPHGGCIWPPRSYTCSFCRREFRSAQALGGHMNVHRRDRARLKQSPTTTSPPPPHHENNMIHQIPFTSSTSSFMGTVIQQPSDQVCSSLIYSPLMINDPNLVVASSPNRVSAASSTQENCTSTKHETLVISPSYTSSTVHNESLFPTPFIRSEPISTARFLMAVSDSSKQIEQENNKKLRERESTAAEISRSRVHDHKISSSAVSLNLVSYSRSRPTRSEEESMISNKRRKTSNTSSTLPFFLKANLIDMDHLKPDGIGLGNKQSSMEDELDLELRLGA